MPDIEFRIGRLGGGECTATFRDNDFFTKAAPEAGGELGIWEEVKFFLGFAFGLRGCPVDPELCAPADLAHALASDWPGVFSIEGAPDDEELQVNADPQDDGNGNPILY